LYGIENKAIHKKKRLPCAATRPKAPLPPACRRIRARDPHTFSKKNVQKDTFFFSKTSNKRAYAIHYKSIKNNPAVFTKINNKKSLRYSIKTNQEKQFSSSLKPRKTTPLFSLKSTIKKAYAIQLKQIKKNNSAIP